MTPACAWPSRPAIDAFWRWWEVHRGEVLSTADAGATDQVSKLLHPAVVAIDPGLAVSSDPDSRPATRSSPPVGGGQRCGALSERWMLSAPASDAEVEYAPIRRADPRAFATTVNVDDHELPLGELVAAARLYRQRVGWTWSSTIRSSRCSPPRLTAGSRSQARRPRSARTTSSAKWVWWARRPMPRSPCFRSRACRPSWTTASTRRPVGGAEGDRPRGAGARDHPAPLARVDRPLCEVYVGVTLPYPAGPDGLPAEESAAADLRSFQLRVLDAMGGDGPTAVLIGQQSGLGRAVVHFYVDGSG